MAVRALPKPRAEAPPQTVAIPTALLALSLLAPAVDLLKLIAPWLNLGNLALVASAAGTAALLLAWARFPRTSWLFAPGGMRVRASG